MLLNVHVLQEGHFQTLFMEHQTIAGQVNADPMSLQHVQSKEEVDLVIFQDGQREREHMARDGHFGTVHPADYLADPHSDGLTCESLVNESL